MSDSLSEQIDALEKALTASYEDEGEKEEQDKKLRMAVIKQAMSDMDDDEKEELKKSFDEPEGEDEEEKTASRRKKKDEEKEGSMDEASDDEDKDEDKEKVAELTAKVAKLTAALSYSQAQPMVNQMIEVRRQAGMSEKELRQLSASLYGKSVDEIKRRYEEDRVLFGSGPTVAPVEKTLPFNGTLQASGDPSGKTLEELFD